MPLLLFLRAPSAFSASASTPPWSGRYLFLLVHLHDKLNSFHRLIPSRPIMSTKLTLRISFLFLATIAFTSALLAQSTPKESLLILSKHDPTLALLNPTTPNLEP